MSIEKIKTLEELSLIVQDLKLSGKKVAHCHGVFDLLHLGHIKHLEAAKKLADVVIVTITQDQYAKKAPGRPVFNENLRAEALASLQCVDYVAINQWSNAVETIKKLKPDFYVKNSEYRSGLTDPNRGIFKENEALQSVGGEIHFTEEVTFSSSHLINNYFNSYSGPVREYLEGLKNKHSLEFIKEKFKDAKKLKALIIGEAVIDEYHFCRPLGKSGKENLVVMKYTHEESYAGGALALANHMSTFCGEVDLITCLGSTDSKTDFIARNLKPNVGTKFFYRDDTQSIVKRRFVDEAFLNKLFEIYYFDDSALPTEVSEQIKSYLESVLSNYDLVVVLDYAHGFLNQELIDLICQKAKFLAVNTQTNSANFGYNLITKYPRADYVCIDEQELRLATHQKFEEVEKLARIISEKLSARFTMVTRGHHGSLFFDKEENIFHTTPIFSNKVVDRVGAGDAFLAITAPCVAAGMPADLVGFVGNMTGALKVQTIGNKTSVDYDSLSKSITAILK